MKRYIFILIFFVLVFDSYTQELIKEAKIQFNLPNQSWKLRNKINKDGKTIYWYIREKIRTVDGIETEPFIAFAIEKLPAKMDLIQYTKQKLSSAPFKQEKIFLNQDTLLAFTPAIGYLGKYIDNKRLEHTMYVVHLINNNKGIEVILDLPTELFIQYEPELRRAMQTISKQITKKKK